MRDVDVRFWRNQSAPLHRQCADRSGGLIFQAGIVAAGSDPTGNTDVPKSLTYYLVAFLVGYREETFRQLIKRLTDVVLTADGAKTVAAPTIALLNPDTGAVSGGTPVTILGTGFTGAKEVKFGANAAELGPDRLGSNRRLRSVRGDQPPQRVGRV